MSLERRRVIGLVIGLLLFGISLALEIVQLRSSDGRGWTGVAYIPRAPHTKKGPPKTFFGFQFGQVVMAAPDGPADLAGLHAGDSIIAVNGVPTDNWDALEKLDGRLKSGDLVTYHVSRGGRVLDVPVRLESPVRSPLFIPSLVIALFVALVFFGIGFVIFLRRPDDRRVVVFYAMTIVAAIYMPALAVYNATNPGQRGISGQQTASSLPQLMVFLVAVMLFAPLLLHLALVFPRPRAIVARFPQIFRWIYGPPLILAATLVWGFQIAITVKQPAIHWTLIVAGVLIALFAFGRIVLRLRDGFDAVRRQPLMSQIAAASIIGTLFTLSLMYGMKVALLTSGVLVVLLFVGGILTYPIATIVALYRSYRESGIEEKRQVKWPLWATIVVVILRLVCGIAGGAIGMATLFTSHRIVNGVTLQLFGSVPHLLYILIPISFAFAIAKYRLMNIDLIIRRTVVYTILTAIVFVVYAALVAGLGTLLVRFAGLHNQTMVIASTIVVALIAVPLRNRLQTVVDRNVFRERTDYPLALRTISDATGRGAGREELLRIAAEQLQQALQNRFVLLVLRSDKHFIATAKVGVADEILGTFRVPAEGVDLSRPIDPAHDPLPTELAQRLRRLDAALLVPMRAQRAAIGFVVLGAKLSNQPFSRDDLEFVDGAASQVAFALESSRLQNEEDDFDQARAMQQVLLPKSMPQLDGFGLAGMWQPARSVGGDYYDAIPIAPGKVAICIADVAGKGMPAALLMAGLQATVKATASSEMSPRRLCGRVRQVLMPNLSAGKFITFFYGVLDAEARTLTYCNAGHNPPLLMRASGAIESLATGGTVLGRLFAGDPYDEATVTLDRGDRVVLFTDGVTEARRGDEDFGESRLAEVVKAYRDSSPNELQDRIVEAITAFTSGTFGDDVTLVVIAAQ